MRIARLMATLALAVPLVCEAQKKEVLELQRTVAQLEDTVAKLKQSQDERMIEIKLLLQQTLDTSTKSATAQGIFDNQLKAQLSDLEKRVAAPVAGLSAKLDSVADEVRFMRQDITDLNTKLNKLDAKMADLDNAVKTIANPPPPPPGSSNANAGPPPGMTAEMLYRDAYRDKLGGNNDLALKQFQDYVTWYKDTANACIAQYYIGEINFAKGDMDPAVQAFDAVLERYPEECAKVPDAHYQKGLALAKLGQRTSAGEEFRELKRKYPTGPWAVKANAELRNLGLSTTAPPSASKKKK